MNEIAENTVLISGGAGSMGQLVSDYINSRDDFTLTAIHDPNYKVPISVTYGLDIFYRSVTSSEFLYKFQVY